MRRFLRSGMAKVFGLLLIQVYLWGGFFAQTNRFPAPPILIANDALGILAGIAVVVWWSRSKVSLSRISVILLYTLLLLMIDFSFFYWSYGSTANFNLELTHLDAIYFAVGTLSTAGTGDISAVSETARGIQTIQMMLDLGFVVLAVAMVVARFSAYSRKAPRNDP